MKRAVILHGLGNSSTTMWFPWLKDQLAARGYEVWVPDLPGADHPVGSKWVNYLLKSSWDFNDNLVIGHSAGAVTALLVAQLLPRPIHINTAVLVSSFLARKPEEEYYADLCDLHNVPFDFTKIKAGADRLLFVHGNNDPWCPLPGAQELAKQTEGELVVVPGGQHFTTSIDPAYTQFPRLLEILDTHHVL